MRTTFEQRELIFDYLNIIANGYRKGDFSRVFPLLAKDCVFESQWVLTPNTGYDAVVAYLVNKGNLLRNAGSFPSCSIQELVGNINIIHNVDVHLNGGDKQTASFGLLYDAGELCLLMEQKLKDTTANVILRIQINHDNMIKRIDLCMPELFQYRDFNTYSIRKFSYSGMDGVQVMQCDYDEDGFGIGCIHDLDPSDPLYLLDSNTMTAMILPEKYQATPIGVYPFYGGYSEGLIMVNTMGEIDLQYHHNFYPCAGMWGWINKEMKEIITPKYIFAMNFVEGKAIVCKGEWSANEEGKYWCEHEQWGIIDKNEQEIIPCRFDEIYEIEGTDNLYFVHEGGWKDGHSAIYDTNTQSIVLVLDFDFDMGYMFNHCCVREESVLMFDAHQPGEETDLVYVYDLIKKEYIVHGEEVKGVELNGETRIVVNKDGKDIIVY